MQHAVWWGWAAVYCFRTCLLPVSACLHQLWLFIIEVDKSYWLMAVLQWASRSTFVTLCSDLSSFIDDTSKRWYVVSNLEEICRLGELMLGVWFPCLVQLLITDWIGRGCLNCPPHLSTPAGRWSHRTMMDRRRHSPGWLIIAHGPSPDHISSPDVLTRFSQSNYLLL